MYYEAFFVHRSIEYKYAFLHRIYLDLTRLNPSLFLIFNKISLKHESNLPPFVPLFHHPDL